MSKKGQHSSSSVVSINPYNNTYLSGISTFLNETNSPESSKDQFVISYLNTKDFITSQIAISKNIPDEDLFDAVSFKVYDEFALDQAIEYKIQFIETFSNQDEENRHFHVFIVDPIVVSQTFNNPVEKLNYIDILIPVPLLLKSLYVKEIIDGDGAHCFVYFQKNDAFVTIYNEQEFIYTRSIKFSFIEMHERFCELYGERIEYENFMDFLSKDNLKDTSSDYKKYFIKLYKEIFTNINDILTYAKRAFEIEKIEKLYIGTQVFTQTKLAEIAEVELGIRCDNFDFNYGYESNKKHIEQLHTLMHIYTTLQEEDKYQCNFTIFYRPPTFTKRESGKIILLSIASFLIAFAYPITYWSLTYAQSLQHDILQKQYNELHIIKTLREATIKSKELDKSKILTLLNKEKQEYQDKKNTLIQIHNVKVNYPMKAKLLSILTKDLNQFNVKIDSIQYQEDNKTKIFTINLVSKNNKKITKLVQYLTKVYHSKFKFSLQKIYFDDDLGQYFSELKVEIL